VKTCVCTRADSGIQEMINISHPIIRSKCKEWDADFIILDRDISPLSTHYRILEFSGLLDKYEMVLSLDTDMIITPRCPNPFDWFGLNAYGQVVTVFEDQGSRQEDRVQRMSSAVKFYGSEKEWVNGYPNSGFMLFPKECQEYFTGQNYPLWEKSGYDDVYLGFLINELSIPVRGAHHKWNHMTMFSEPWSKSRNRFESYIIHYAGQGIFDYGVKTRIEQMKLDKERLYG